MWIIDFDLAIHFPPTSKKFIKGYQGTKGYIAPEVSDHVCYDPFLADVWSVGKVMHIMGQVCIFYIIVFLLLYMKSKLFQQFADLVE